MSTPDLESPEIYKREAAKRSIPIMIRNATAFMEQPVLDCPEVYPAIAALILQSMEEIGDLCLMDPGAIQRHKFARAEADNLARWAASLPTVEPPSVPTGSGKPKLSEVLRSNSWIEVRSGDLSGSAPTRNKEADSTDPAHAGIWRFQKPGSTQYRYFVHRDEFHSRVKKKCWENDQI
ncbi:hypothetical protein [Rhodopirellula islandica]|uniref:hypothetical protein n=1 Tax=Rhodopirellula islandica TaxID=595434 RepID=UPI0012376809|nr:hypothetical protein [Rhodopirellula islandica]